MIGIKSIIYYIFLAAAAVLSMLFMHNTISVIIAAFVFVIPPAAILLQSIVMSSISIELDQRNNNIGLGYDRPVYVTVKNPVLIPIVSLNFDVTLTNGFYGKKTSYTYSLPVYPKKTQRLILTQPKFDFAGNYTVTIENVYAWDFVHFYSFPKKIEQKKLIPVLPKLYTAASVIWSESFADENNDTQESSKKGSDYPEVRDVREYIPGDSLKNIHWKLSAKRDMLMVKEHISLASDSVAVVIELTDDGSNVLERILRTAYTVLMDWSKKGIVYTVWWWSDACNDMRSQKVNNVTELSGCFGSIMFDKPYETTDKALTGIKFAKSYMHSAVWINACKNRQYGNIVLHGGDVLDIKENNDDNKGKRKPFSKRFKKKENAECKAIDAFVSFVNLE